MMGQQTNDEKKGIQKAESVNPQALSSAEVAASATSAVSSSLIPKGGAEQGQGIEGRAPGEIGVFPALMTDKDALDVFFSTYDNAHTLRVYRREIAAFMAHLVEHVAPSDPSFDDPERLLPQVRTNHIDEYIQTISDTRKSNGVRVAAIALNVLFSTLSSIDRGDGDPYCRINPAAISRRRKSVVKKASRADKSNRQTLSYRSKAFTEMEVRYIMMAIEAIREQAMMQQDERLMLHYHRARWLIVLMMGCWLRRHEACRLRMGDFHRDSFSDRLKSPYAGWYVTVYGKGGVTETIVANELVIRELEAYRIANDLYPPLPHPDDETEMERPAILSVNSAHRRNGAISDQMIYMICKEIFSRASEIAESHSDRQAAQRLARATPHWFRHTGVTWALDAGASPRAVMAQARHASINTTMRYDHPDMRQMTDILSSMLSCIRGH